MIIFRVGEDSMARPRSDDKPHNLKMTAKAYKAARIAAGYTGESIVSFVSRIVEERATEIIEEQHRLLLGEGKKTPSKKNPATG
jgi:uncharacterized protein (DUF1778 family)